MRRTWYIGLGIVLVIIAALLSAIHDLRLFVLLIIILGIIWIYDRCQKKHAILRNFPILGHLRYFLEFFRPEIQQYFVADDHSERPFDRETRTIVYERAKGVRDTVAFGTTRDLDADGQEWVLHSLAPKAAGEVESRIIIGGPACLKPYSASHLNISAMSHGALSPNAILALNQGAKIGNFAHNTGEGGLSEYHLAGGGDIIFQFGTAYFGCRDKDGNFDEQEFAKEAANDAVKMIEIKLSQGAKPSHGGILPAAKLTEEIARIRKVPMGQDVMSPPMHTAFSTPIGLMKFVERVRSLCGGKPVGFKLCLGQPHEFMGICKAMLETGILPDFITVDGAEGGTGAAPLEYVNHVGIPLDAGLVLIHNSLVGVGLRDKIRIIASGKIITGFDMVTKLALGADLCNSARGMMMALGCIQSLQCNANTCPTGVATQNERLMKGLVPQDKKIRVANFHHATVHSFLELVGAMGLSSPSDICPSMVRRRIDPKTVQAFDEVYPFLEPNDLLNPASVLPPRYKKYWNDASAAEF